MKPCKNLSQINFGDLDKQGQVAFKKPKHFFTIFSSSSKFFSFLVRTCICVLHGLYDPMIYSTYKMFVGLKIDRDLIFPHVGMSNLTLISPSAQCFISCRNQSFYLHLKLRLVLYKIQHQAKTDNRSLILQIIICNHQCTQSRLIYFFFCFQCLVYQCANLNLNLKHKYTGLVIHLNITHEVPDDYRSIFRRFFLDK